MDGAALRGPVRSRGRGTAAGEGADVAARKEKDGTALHYAAKNWHEAVARLLLEKGAGSHPSASLDSYPPLSSP